MKLFHKMRKISKKLHPYARVAIQIGFYTMICMYIVAVFAYWIAPHAANYINAVTVYHGALEAAPACSAAGVSAGLLCDIIYRSRNPNGKDQDDGDL